MFTESKKNEPLTVIIVGAGHRSLGYADLCKTKPDRIKVVGVADPNPLRCEMCRERYGFPKENIFSSAEELAKVPRFADAVINGTMDQQHVETTIPLLKAGYHVLLEKPFAVNEKEMWQLYEAVKKYDRKVLICHVLRYAPFYSLIRQKIIDGEIGDIIATETTEHVSYHHMAMGYVRGKWRNEKLCHASMLLAKSCHDIDLIMWMNSGNKPVSVASFGSTFQFKPEKAPAGCGTRCMKDCPKEIEEKCLYSAKKMFIDHPDRWSMYVWDNIEHIKNPTIEDKIKTITEDSLYGRCVYKCDNDVVDHQTTIINFENGATASHNMIGGSAAPQRSIHIIGTKGEILGVLDSKDPNLYFTLRKIDPRPNHEYSDEKIYVNESSDTTGVTGGHGGGDLRLVDDFISYVHGEQASISCTRIEDSINGHLCVYLADESRETGKIINFER